MKQTAVEWLVEQLQQNKFITESKIHIAKELEKQQIIDAYLIGDKDAGIYSATKQNAEQYYNETFKNK